MSTGLDMDHLRGWIGRTAESEDLVAARLVDEFETTLLPRLAPVGPGEAPLAIHWCLSPSAPPEAELGPDGHALRGGFLPPVPLPRRMWAGGEIELVSPLRAGDTVRRRSVIQDVRLKEGRSGALVFVAVGHDYETSRGTAIRERHDIVYRDLPAPGAPAPIPDAAPRESDLAWTVPATPVLLFRYSALTFNGHRIHYDHPYATGVEGYPGLVVHGPLQSTLLLNIVAVLGGQAPARFRYRGVHPLIAGEPFEVAARRLADGRIAAWTRDPAGRICMEAETL